MESDGYVDFPEDSFTVYTKFRIAQWSFGVCLVLTAEG